MSGGVLFRGFDRGVLLAIVWLEMRDYQVLFFGSAPYLRLEYLAVRYIY
jgi:hypothetical protein